MLVRLFLIVFTPPFMVWVFVAELWSEAKRAPYYAWLECRIEFDAVRRAWRTKTLISKD
jgi:hypothetical protein